MRHIRATALACALAALLHSAVALAADPLGALSVITDPAGAAVYVNGEMKGSSPCLVADVPVGIVEVRVEKQGWSARPEDAEINPGGTTRVSITMQPVANVGELSVLVDPPGSRVWVDRVPAGRTPLSLLNVAAGAHQIKVTANGYREMLSTVNVAAGAHPVLRGRLTPLDPGDTENDDGAPSRPLGVLEPEDVPSPDQLPEEEAMEPVRALLSQRLYEEALARLDRMSSDPNLRKYAQKTALLRRMTRLMQAAAEAGWQGLKNLEGQACVLTLRQGIRMTGKLVKVTDSQVVLQAGNREHRFGRADLGAEQLVAAASNLRGSVTALNRARYAVLLASDRLFERAYEHLRAAADAGLDISDARAYVDAEHIWAAAVEMAEAGGRSSRAGSLAPPQSPMEHPTRVALDMHRGISLPGELLNALKERGADVARLEEPYSAETGNEIDVLLVRDGGPGRPAPAYGREELQGIMDFVRRGGGLVFIGAPGSRGGQKRFDLLLQWYGIRLRTDSLAVDKDAPEEYPEQYALAVPVVASPITYNVGRMVMPIGSASLAVENGGWIVVRALPLVRSRQTGEKAPVLVAAREFGRGRVVVFSAMPELTNEPSPRSPLHGNGGADALLNALLWAAGGRSRADQ